MLGMCNFQHVHSLCSAVTYLRQNTSFIQNNPGMFGRNLFIIHNQNAHIPGIDKGGCCALPIGIGKRNNYREFRTDSFF